MRPETELIRFVLSLRAAAGIARLSARFKEVIDLVYYHHKSVKDVAKIVGASEATVETRMFYARQQMREILKAAGHDSV